jgi:hypothetical protein
MIGYGAIAVRGVQFHVPSRHTRVDCALRDGPVACSSRLSRNTHLPQAGVYSVAWGTDHRATRESGSIVVRGAGKVATGP